MTAPDEGQTLAARLQELRESSDCNGLELARALLEQALDLAADAISEREVDRSLASLGPADVGQVFNLCGPYGEMHALEYVRNSYRFKTPDGRCFDMHGSDWRLYAIDAPS